MNIETKSTHTTPVGGNVFADLGFDEREAAELKARSQRVIAEELARRETDLASTTSKRRTNIESK